MIFYEAIVAINSSVGKEKIDSMVSKFENKITSSGGKIEKIDNWGNKRVPFRFQKHKNLKEATYIYILFQSEPALPSQLTYLFRVTEGVVRFSVIKSEATNVKEILENQPEEEKVEIAASMLGESEKAVVAEGESIAQSE